MARSVRARHARRSSSSVRVFVMAGLLLSILIGAVLVWLGQDAGRWPLTRKTVEPENGGKLVLKDLYQERLQSGLASGQEDKEGGAKADFPKIKEELTFYQTLTDQGQKHATEPQLKPGGLTPQQEAKTQTGKMTNPASGLSARHYTLQVGSFAEKLSAQRLIERLVSRGYSAYMVKAVLPDQQIRYRVRVGFFPDKMKAKALAERLDTQEGLKSFIAFVEKGVQ